MRSQSLAHGKEAVNLQCRVVQGTGLAMKAHTYLKMGSTCASALASCSSQKARPTLHLCVCT